MDKNQDTIRIRDCPCLNSGLNSREERHLVSGILYCLFDALAEGGPGPFSPTGEVLGAIRQGLEAKVFWPTGQNRKTRAKLCGPVEKLHEASASRDFDWGLFWSPFWIYKVQCDGALGCLIEGKGRVFYRTRMFSVKKPIETRHPCIGAWPW